MERWQDQSIILAARRHGESGAIVHLLTNEHGRQAGYVRGAFSTKNRGTLEVGNLVDANWQARNSSDLGSLTLELVRSTAARIMQDPLKLAALQSACCLCNQALPEKEAHLGIYQGLLALLNILEGEIWGQGYIMWEIALLKELGFSLDLSRCAGGGDGETLAYVSPKTGCAVSKAAGEPYKDKLLPLPEFLKPSSSRLSGLEDIVIGLQMTRFFLEHWVFVHHNGGLPEARERLALRFVEHFAKTKDANIKLDTNTSINIDELGSEIHATG